MWYTVHTWNIWSTTVAVGQYADILATFGGRLVGCRSGIDVGRPGRWETVDVDEFLRPWNYFRRRLQRRTESPEKFYFPFSSQIVFKIDFRTFCLVWPRDELRNLQLATRHVCTSTFSRICMYIYWACRNKPSCRIAIIFTFDVERGMRNARYKCVDIYSRRDCNRCIRKSAFDRDA